MNDSISAIVAVCLSFVKVTHFFQNDPTKPTEKRVKERKKERNTAMDDHSHMLSSFVYIPFFRVI